MKNILYKHYLITTFLLWVLFFSSSIFSDDAPPQRISTFEIAGKIAAHYTDYLHYEVIGACLWLKGTPATPYTKTTFELDEYLPDLIVTVYNESGDDPWDIANDLLDKIAQSAGNAAIKIATGDDLTEGRNSALLRGTQNSSDITKSVDVIGSPMSFMSTAFPNIFLQFDTKPLVPYYQSALDAFADRGDAESLRLETADLFSHYIGGPLNHWAYEFPRTMTVSNDNDYKASVVIALHAADIVTNKHVLHVVNATNNKCGKSCAASNVIEEMSVKHPNEIWQEVYPHDHFILLGESDLASLTPLYQDDINAGHGNYVFVIWRHYRGCVQTPGKFLGATTHINPTQKR